MNGAQAVYQQKLDVMNTALFEGRIEDYLAHYRLPLVSANLDGATTIRSHDVLRQLVEDYLHAFAQRGIDNMVGICEAARVDPSGCIDGYHLSSFLANGAAQGDPVQTRLVMDRDLADWKVFKIETGLGREMWPVRPETFAPAPGRDLTDDQFAAYTIFQSTLNVSTMHVLNCDADGLSAQVLFPLFVQSRAGRFTIPDADAMEADLRIYRDEFEIHSVDDVYRPLKTAEFVGPDKITGTYRTYILSHGRLVVEPYESAMTLQHCPDGRWRITSVMHGLGHLNWRYPGTGD